MFGGDEVVDEKNLSPEELHKKKFTEIVDLLLAAGYFRARIQGLSDFDKIVGGLTWCLTAASVDVDVDVVFQENSTIGMKIKLGEQIVAAVRKMKCPHALHTAQIRGLDMPNLFPVIQWLVKKVIETREETGDLVRRFSESQFEKTYDLPSEVAMKKDLEQVEPFVDSIFSHYRPTRQYRRPGDMLFQNPSEHTESVLLEYGGVFAAAGERQGKKKDGEKDSGRGKASSKFQDGEGRASSGVTTEEEAEERRLKGMMSTMDAVAEGEEEISSVNLKGLMGRYSEQINEATSAYDETAARLKGQASEEQSMESLALQAHKRQMAQLERQMALASKKRAELDALQQSLGQQVQEKQDLYMEKLKYNERCIFETKKLKDMETPENARTLQQLRALITLNENLKKQEAEFRASCGKTMKDLKAKIANSRENAPEEEMERVQQIEDMYENDMEKLQRIRELLAEKNQEVAMISRMIDEIPTRVELIQYERRFVELYQQVAAKLEETRKYYALYNTCSDTKVFLSKEVSLMNSIYENFQTCMRSKGGAQMFLKSIEEVLVGVKGNLSKVSSKKENEMATKEILTEKLSKTMERQRRYFKALKEFQEECDKNEQLMELCEVAGQ